jgi:ribonuclease-3
LDKAAIWLKKTLAYEFEDEHLLRQALTHRSAPGPNNERLEFLGDAVLQLAISELVFENTENASEGQLSRLRSTLVKDTTLAEVATFLGIGEHLILGSGEQKSGGHRRSSILADSLEAIFGAVYINYSHGLWRQIARASRGSRSSRSKVAPSGILAGQEDGIAGLRHAENKW